MNEEQDKEEAERAAPAAERNEPDATSRALEELFAFADVMGLMMLLAAPRFLARTFGELGARVTTDAMVKLLDGHIATIARVNAGTYADADGRLRRTEEPTRRARALIETWEPSPSAPHALIEAARDFFTAYGAGEPVVPWDVWDGDETKLPPRPPSPTLRTLRDEPLTLSQWLTLDEPGELAHGMLREEEATPPSHEAAIAWLMDRLTLWSSHQQILVRGPSHKLGINETTGYKPDISLYISAPDGRRSSAESAHVTLPWVVVEVLSGRAQDAALDRGEKLETYESIGVPWCWFVDPHERLFEVYSLRDGRYTWANGATEGRVHVPGAQGLVLDLDALWSDLDRSSSCGRTMTG